MIAVLASWILVLLAVATLSMSADVRGQIRLQDRMSDRLRSEALAWAGQSHLQFVYTTNQTDIAWHGGQSLQLPAELSSPVPLELGSYSLWDPDDQRTPRLVDEERRIPRLALSPTILAEIGVADRKIQTELIAASTSTTADWWHAVYTADVDSLARLTILDSITPFETDGVNINTAPVEILTFLGVPLTAARKIHAHRIGADAVAGTPDDRLITALDVPERGLRPLRLTSQEAAVLSFLIDTGQLIDESRVVRATSWGWIEDGPGVCRLDAVYRRSSKGLELIHWERSWIH